MTITQNYKNAFAEVYTILDYIEDEDYAKIPPKVISVIEENRNLDYEYEMNEDVDIYSQPMLPETKAILFNFYRDYWSTPEQKSKIIKMQNEEIYKIDKEKSKKYNPNDMFKNQNERVKNETKEETAMVNVKDEKFFR